MDQPRRKDVIDFYEVTIAHFSTSMEDAKTDIEVSNLGKVKLFRKNTEGSKLKWIGKVEDKEYIFVTPVTQVNMKLSRVKDINWSLNGEHITFEKSVVEKQAELCHLVVPMCSGYALSDFKINLVFIQDQEKLLRMINLFKNTVFKKEWELTMDENFNKLKGVIKDFKTLESLAKDTLNEYINNNYPLNSYVTECRLDSFGFMNTAYYSQMIFEMLVFYHLKWSQICDVLDYCKDMKMTCKHILNTIYDTKVADFWFIDIKRQWLENHFSDSDNNTQAISVPLAYLPWTRDMTAYFVDKFKKEILTSKLSTWGTLRDCGLLKLSFVEVLKIITKSEILEVFVKKVKITSYFQTLNKLRLKVKLPLNGSFYLFKDIFKRYATLEYGPLIHEIASIKNVKSNSVESFFKKLQQQLLYENSITSKDDLLKILQEKKLRNEKSNRFSIKRTHTKNIKKKYTLSGNDHDLKVKKFCDDNIDNLELELHAFYKTCETISYKVVDFEECLEENKRLWKENSEEHLIYRDLAQKLVTYKDDEIFTHHFTLEWVIRVFDSIMNPRVITPSQKATILTLIGYYNQDEKLKRIASLVPGDATDDMLSVIAAYFAFQKQRVDIVTSSLGSGILFYEEYNKFFEELGLVSAVISEKMSKTHREYQHLDIILSPLEVLTSLDLFPTRRRKQNLILLEPRRTLLQFGPENYQLMDGQPLGTAGVFSMIFVDIFKQVNNEYNNMLFSHDWENLATDDIILKRIKSSFKQVKGEESPENEVQRLLNIENEDEFLSQLPELIAVDRVGYRQLFHPNNYLCCSNIRVRCSVEHLESELQDRNYEGDSDFVFYKGDCQADQYSVCIYSKNGFAWLHDTLRIKESSTYTYLNFTEIKVRPEAPIIRNEELLDHDLDLSLQIACALDKEAGIQSTGILSVLNYWKRTFCDDEELKIDLQLRIHIGYLRQVHLYCYYKNILFKDKFTILTKSFYPPTLKVVTDDTLSILNDQQLKEFYEERVKFIQRLNTKKRYNFANRNDQFMLKEEFLSKIDLLSPTLREYAFLKFDTWIENCFKALIYDSKEALGLEESPFERSGFEQFMCIKNNEPIVPFQMTSTPLHLSEFLSDYEAIIGITESITEEETIDFLKDVFGIKTITFGSPETDFTSKNDKSSKLKGLSYDNERGWLNAIIHTIRHQVTSNTSVIVYCRSEYDIINTFQPVLSEALHDLSGVTIHRIINLIEIPDTSGVSVLLATSFSKDRMVKLKNIHRDIYICLTYLPESSEEEKLFYFAKRSSNGFARTTQKILYDKVDRSVDQLVIERKKRYTLHWKSIRDFESSTDNSFKNISQTFKKFLKAHFHQVSNKLQLIFEQNIGYLNEDIPQNERISVDADGILTNKLSNHVENYISHYDLHVEVDNTKVSLELFETELYIQKFNETFETEFIIKIIFEAQNLWICKYLKNRIRETEEEVERKFQECLACYKNYTNGTLINRNDHHIYFTKTYFEILQNDNNISPTHKMDLLKNVLRYTWLKKDSTPALAQYTGILQYYYTVYLLLLLHNPDNKIVSEVYERILSSLSNSVIVLQKLITLFNNYKSYCYEFEAVTSIFSELKTKVEILKSSFKINELQYLKNLEKMKVHFAYIPIENYKFEDKRFKDDSSERAIIEKVVIDICRSFGLYGIVTIDAHYMELKKSRHFLNFRRVETMKEIKVIKDITEVFNIHKKANSRHPSMNLSQQSRRFGPRRKDSKKGYYVSRNNVSSTEDDPKPHLLFLIKEKLLLNADKAESYCCKSFCRIGEELSERLQSLSNFLTLIIVFYDLPERPKIYFPDDIITMKAERFVYDSCTKEWNICGESSRCLYWLLNRNFNMTHYWLAAEGNSVNMVQYGSENGYNHKMRRSNEVMVNDLEEERYNDVYSVKGSGQLPGLHMIGISWEKYTSS